jgi:hypothetical protein
MNALDVKCLRPIYIADTGKHRLIKQQSTDFRAAAPQPIAHEHGIRVAAQRILPQAIDDLRTRRVREQFACGRPVEVESMRITPDAQANLPARFGHRQLVSSELAVKAQVNMKIAAPFESKKKMFAVRIDFVQPQAVEPPCA